MKWLSPIFAIALTCTLAGCGLAGCGGRYVRDAQDTVYGEFKASELLRKYEWFKDAAAQLEKKQADISVYAVRIESIEESYGETPRKDWDRTDKEQLNMWHAEAAGVKASYNGLAAEYNANMAKFNWSFCDAGKLPQGATEPLPREFKPYTTQ